VRVNLLSPGPTRTAMRAQAFPGEDPARLKPPERVAAVALELCLPQCTRHGETVRVPD
jgi:NAD(P)-dependent dehydrogenase (short-subunit alcohol dehydrogenase family)